MLDFDELQEFPKISSWATKSEFISDLMGTQNHQKNLRLNMIARLSFWQVDYSRLLSRRLERCDRVIQKESDNAIGGNV